MISANEVDAELDKQKEGGRKKSLVHNIALLTLSLVVFAGTGLLNQSWLSVAIIVLVLFIHESGHWLGMKLFGFRDVQMFFIPFFGAAVSGGGTNIGGERKAIVALLGPLPGILFGIVSLIMYIKWKQPVFLAYGSASLFINGFNLLPFFPLDGGRFLEIVLFSRHTTVELGFRILAALALAWWAWQDQSLVLGIVAFFTLVLVRENYHHGKVAGLLKDRFKDLPLVQAERMPLECIDAIMPQLSLGIPAARLNAKILATRAGAVWKRVCQKQPRLWPSIALLVVYFGLWFVVFAAIIIHSRVNHHVVIEQRVGEDGKTVAVEEIYQGKNKVFEAPLNETSYFDGPSTTWRSTGLKWREGAWVNGFSNGDWKFYDTKGNLESIITYDNGRPVKYRVFKDEALVEIDSAQWPSSIKYVSSKKPAGYNK